MIFYSTIGNVKDAIQGKQNTINDGDLSISEISGLDTCSYLKVITGLRHRAI
jgi:hypothetical protein